MKVARPTARRRAPRWPSRRRTPLAALLGALLAIAGIGLAASPAPAEELPVSSLEIQVTACAEYGGQGDVRYTVRDPFDFYQDFITIVDAGDVIVHEAVYRDGTEFIDEVALDPGDYTIIYTVERETGGANIDRQAFTIGACPDLDLGVTTSCSTGADGAATVAFTGLVAGESYTYFVEGPAGSSGAFDASGPDETVVVGDLPPGNYYVYVEWRPDETATAAAPAPMFDWRGFAVEPCQPAIALEVTECTATGGTGSALLTLSDLVAGVEYDVAVTDLGDADGTPYGGAQTVTADESGTARLTLTGLPAGTDFTAWVDGIWTTDPWVEPPFIGNGGNFVPLETVFLTASADFSLAPCPTPPVTPDEPAKPAALPATGVDGAGGLLAAGALLVLAGALAILARRRTGPHPD